MKMLRVSLFLGAICLVSVSCSVEDQLHQLQRETDQLKTQAAVSAAFSTRLSEDTELGDNAVIFDTVDLNIGGGYDEFTGVFEPPVNGVYTFTVYAVTTRQANGPMYIKSGGTTLCEAFLTEGDSQVTATCTAIVELTTDDLVRVTGDTNNRSFINGGSSGFVGHYIGAV